MLKGTINLTNDFSGNLMEGDKLLNHTYLTNRETKNAHPISAITDLTEKLDSLAKADSKLLGYLHTQKNELTEIIESEQTRAREAEALLDFKIEQIQDKISSNNSSNEIACSDIAEALQQEALERIKEDTSLALKIGEIRKVSDDTRQMANTFITEADGTFDEIAKTLGNHEKLFEEHVKSFDSQTQKLNNLITEINSYITIFEQHITNASNNSVNFSNALNALDEKFTEKLSYEIDAERNTSKKELELLTNQLSADLALLKDALNLNISKNYNEIIDYVNSEAERLTTIITAEDENFALDISKIQTALEEKTIEVEEALNLISLELQTIKSQFKAADDSLTSRLEITNTTISNLVETVKVNNENLENKIESLLSGLTEVNDFVQEHISQTEVQFNNIHKKIDDNVALVSESLESLESVLEDKIEQETINRTTAVNKIEADYKEADINILQTVFSRMDNLSAESTEKYEEQSAKIINDYKEADKNVYLEAQKFTTEATKGLNTRLADLESWKSTVFNVMDFVGVTDTDITRPAYKKNATIRIGTIIYIANKGDVVIFDNKEYVWTGGEEESAGWEEIGVGTANEAAIAELQLLVGSNSSTNPSGIFKEIHDMQNSFENKLAIETEQTDSDISELREALESQLNLEINQTDTEINKIINDITKINDDIAQADSSIQNITDNLNNFWVRPQSLIFESKTAAESYILSNPQQVFPGQLITIDAEGILETFVIDTNGTLQLLSGSGGGSGSPDKVTDTQYCIQVKYNKESEEEFIPKSLDDFMNNTDAVVTISIPNPKRKNNSISTTEIEAPGGYIYYASKLANLKFTSLGFDAGFSIYAFIADYNIYRSAQRIIDPVDIVIN